MDTTRTRLLIALALLICPEVRGQEILHYVDSEAFAVQRAHVFPAGDRNGDGFADYAVGCVCLSHGGVTVHSGIDGRALWTHEPTGSQVVTVSALDYDGDGIDDYLAAMPFSNQGILASGKVAVYGGGDSEELLALLGPSKAAFFGWTVDALGDLDGDGRDEFAVTSAHWDPVQVYRGGDGAIFREHVAESSYSSVARVGDTDGDGVADYVIGSGVASAGSIGSAGLVRLHSGIDGSVLFEWNGFGTFQYLGAWVAGAGDVNADGVPDVIAGAPGAITNNHGSGTGYARVYSGADGSILHHLTPLSSNRNFGQKVEAGGDLNGDGYDDVIVGASRFGGDLYVFSGRTGSLLWWKTGDNETSVVGRQFALLGDTNGDGLDDWAFADGVFLNDFGAPGRLFICSGALGADSEQVCAGELNSTNEVALLGTQGSISLTDQNLTLRTVNLPLQQFGLCFYGPPADGTPFGNGELCVGSSPPGFWRLGPPQPTGSTGVIELAVDFGAPPVATGPGAWLAGSSWTVQLWYRDPAAGGASFNLSTATQILFAP